MKTKKPDRKYSCFKCGLPLEGVVCPDCLEGLSTSLNWSSPVDERLSMLDYLDVDPSYRLQRVKDYLNDPEV